MIEVMNSWWPGFAIAAVAGAAGGLIYELLTVRSGDSGMIEWPGWVTPPGDRRSFFDLGFLAPVLVGATAAVGFLYFMPPTEVRNASSELVRREYDPFRLVAATLIVGSAGESFLKAMQERVRRVAAEEANRNAAAILESETTDAAGGLISAGAGGMPVSRDKVIAAIQVLRSK